MNPFSMKGFDMSASNNNAVSWTWRAIIDDLEDVTFKLKTCPIPGLACNNINLYSADEFLLPTSGDRLGFNPFEIEFFIDETWENYIKIHEWILRYAADGVVETKDITIQLLNNVNKLIRTFYMQDCFPINMSDVSMTTIDDDSYLSVTTEFAYSKWSFV